MLPSLVTSVITGVPSPNGSWEWLASTRTCACTLPIPASAAVRVLAALFAHAWGASAATRITWELVARFSMRIGASTARSARGLLVHVCGRFHHVCTHFVHVHVHSLEMLVGYRLNMNQ